MPSSDSYAAVSSLIAFHIFWSRLRWIPHSQLGRQSGTARTDHVPGFRFHVSGCRLAGSYSEFRLSHLWFRALVFTCQISGFRFAILGLRFYMSRFPSKACGFSFQDSHISSWSQEGRSHMLGEPGFAVSDFWFLISDFGISGFWFLISYSPSLMSDFVFPHSKLRN